MKRTIKRKRERKIKRKHKKTQRRRKHRGGAPFYKVSFDIDQKRDFGKDPDLNANDRLDSP